MLGYLANLYENQGDYSKTDSIYQASAQIIRNAYGGENNIDYAKLLANWGDHYYNQNNLTKAENLYNQALQIYKNTKNEDELYFHYLLKKIIYIHGIQGEYEKEEALLQDILKKEEKVFGKENDTYASTLNSLAIIYLHKGDYAQAEKLMQEVLQIYQNYLGEEILTYLTLLENLAVMYRFQRKYVQAEEILQQVLEKRKAIHGEKHPNYAYTLQLLGDLYRVQKFYDKAMSLFEQALEIIRKTKGEKHTDYFIILNSIAITHQCLQNFDKASPLFVKIAENKIGEIQNNLSNLSESGKQKYLNEHKYFLINLHIFIRDVLEKKPDFKDLPLLCQTAFNLQLQTKGWLLSETQKLRNRINASKDSLLIRQMQLWQAKKNFIAKAYNMTATERKNRKLDLKKLETEADDMEKQLAIRSVAFASAFTSPAYTYQDIQKKLGKNEVAIEMVKGSIINWEKMKPDTTFYYFALVLTPNDLFPVLLDKVKEIEGRQLNLYRNFMKGAADKVNEDTSYQVFWKPIEVQLEKNLGKVSRIYFSPDGAYNFINLNTLLNPHTGRYLLEDYDIQIVTNLKEILEDKKPNTGKKAILFGRPAYDMDKQTYETERQEVTRCEKDSELNLNIKYMKFGDLIGTEVEIKGIEEVLKKSAWTTETYLGKQAIEERLKIVTNPSILHIATHGYFAYTDAKNKINGMVSLGIVLAGVYTEKSAESEDGILTALDASNLNLDETDLVVLSACETGLGEEVIGEGVYGLQRGFKVAGAKAVIMSLWKVNDTATQELMNTFYELWLSGKPKREAFKQAQLQMKEKYKFPHYWGAFVMVGK